MKKFLKLFILCVVVATIISMVACGKKNESEQTKDNLKGEITVLTDGKYEGALKLHAENFKKLHPKVIINVKSENNFYGNLGERFKQEKSSIDIANIENMYLQTFLSKASDTVYDVSDEISSYKDKILKNKIDNVYYKNKMYGVPWISSPKVMLYRKDIFNKEGINPEDIKTWADFIAAGKKIKSDTGKRILPNVINDYSDIKLLLPNQLGVSFVNKDGNPDFLSKQWVKAITEIKALYAEGILFDVELEQSVMNLAMKDEIVSFIAGPQLIHSFESKIKEEKGKWGIMKLPAFEFGGNRDVSIGGSSFIINKNTSKMDIAKEFIKYTVTDEGNSIDCLNKHGIFPVSIDTYNLKEFNNVNPCFDSRVWSTLSSVDKGAYYMNYTSTFSLLRALTKDVLNESNMKDKEANAIADYLQKESEKRLSEVK